MKTILTTLSLCGAISTAVLLSACGSSSSSGVIPVGPVDARKADGSCDLSTKNAYLTDETDSCQVKNSNNQVLGVMSCVGGAGADKGFVTYTINGTLQTPNASWRGITIPGATHQTTFRCKNHPTHPAV